MIDPLRPYWPTNRSLAGLLSRSALLIIAAGVVVFSGSRPFSVLVVLGCAFAQASILVLEWMEFRRTGRPGLIAAAILALLGFSLAAALVIEARSVLILSVR